MTHTSAATRRQSQQTQVDDAARERLSTFLLLQLDPLLKALLTLVQQYQNELSSSILHQRHLQLLQSQQELLKHLDDKLESLSRLVLSQPRNQDAADLWNRALSPLKDYLTLPLVAIIKGTPLRWSAVTPESSSSDRILQSKLWSVVERSAQIYQRHMPCWSLRPTQQEESRILKLMVACAFALPAGQELEGPTTETNQSATRLDRGTDCLLAVLTLIQHATGTVETPSQPTQASIPLSFSKQVVQTMKGGLLARLVDTCVTLLKMASSEQPASIPRKTILAANRTIQGLLHAVPLSQPWRAAFPGCFGGLYKSLQQQVRATSLQAKLAAVTLETLVRLMKLTLVTTDDSREQVNAVTKLQSAFQSLSLQAAAPKQGGESRHEQTATSSVTPVQASPMYPKESPEEFFFAQVRNRLVSPLIVLVRQLVTVRAVSVRRQAVDLYHVLLLESNSSCWNDDTMVSAATSSGIVQAAVESCMILTNDSDESVSTAAKTVVDRYGNSHADASPLETVIAIMEELPVLVLRHRQVELRMKLKLVNAYLAMNVSAKTLYARLCMNGSTDWIQGVLSPLYDVEFESVGENVLPSVSLVAVTQTGSVPLRPSDPLLRYLDDDTRDAANQCIRQLGRALGTKYVALLMDAIVADAYESLADRMERGTPLTGLGQVAWLHERIGSLILAKNLLEGSLDEEATTDKELRRRVRVLEELASSIIPLLTSSALVDLPSRRWTDDLSADNEVGVATALVMRGNAAFLTIVLDVISTLFVPLKQRGKKLLPTALFAILEKASWIHATTVQEMAIYVLEKIGVACGYSGRVELVLANLDTLIGSMNTRLRIPGGSMLSTHFLLDRNSLLVAMAASALLRVFASDGIYSEGLESANQPILPQLQRLFGNLLNRFDYSATKITERCVEPLIFLELFDGVLSYLQHLNGIVDLKDNFTEPQETRFDLTEQLEPFRIDSPESLPAAEGFTQYHTKKASTLPVEPDGLDRSLLTNQLLFVNDVISRSCYLLSHTSLQVRIAACKIASRGFEFLGWIAAHVPEKQGENNGPTTAILRQVHTHWPSISARIKATASSLTVGESGSSSSILVAPGEIHTSSLITAKAQPKGEVRIFVSELFILVGVMCNSAGDFMSRHYREIIWPCVGKAVGSVLPTTTSVSYGRTRRIGDCRSLPAAGRNLTDSEVRLLMGVMRCLSYVYRQRPLGLSVSHLIASTGVMILPFLGHERLCQASMDALERMAKIDCDALYPQLMNLSGQTIPSVDSVVGKPLDSKSVALKIVDTSFNEPLNLAAHRLLNFIEALPEQSFD